MKKNLLLVVVIATIMMALIGLSSKTEKKGVEVVANQSRFYTAEERERIQKWYEASVANGEEDIFYYYKDKNGHLWVGWDYTKRK